jgi:NAD(P)-dependent dehydrogenase (short-subunit alcohol dehydrogenase family)
LHQQKTFIMKIIIVGASGTIGKKVTAELSGRHEVIKAGIGSGDITVDITSTASIEQMFKKAGPFDALISTTGNGHFGLLRDMTAEDFKIGLHNKLLGQVNLVLIGQHYINPKGSFTLTSGIMAQDPIRYGANITTVNAALEGFVTGAHIELENGVRINAVSPGVVEDSPQLHSFFHGHIPVKMEKVVAAFVKSVEGAQSGQVFRVAA